ncbi:hypothetical protein CPB83DRAFT_900730 [Crepidotus variabilis]|uniref:peptidylprolyl isomerase n=1 Tax=Crepidotus variabilis TaxID=179855 RepID=A0A9P6E091_9AGAR|nr:hypothetical protein CPB83DRAFT_900730 [Crepidotus variabilis]
MFDGAKTDSIVKAALSMCLTLKPLDVVQIKPAGILTIRNACFGHNLTNSGTAARTSVRISHIGDGEERESFLCSLTPGKIEQVSLHIPLGGETTYNLSCLGRNTVYLLGTLEDEPERLLLEGNAPVYPAGRVAYPRHLSDQAPATIKGPPGPMAEEADKVEGPPGEEESRMSRRSKVLTMTEPSDFSALENEVPLEGVNGAPQDNPEEGDTTLQTAGANSGEPSTQPKRRGRPPNKLRVNTDAKSCESTALEKSSPTKKGRRSPKKVPSTPTMQAPFPSPRKAPPSPTKTAPSSPKKKGAHSPTKKAPSSPTKSAQSRPTSPAKALANADEALICLPVDNLKPQASQNGHSGTPTDGIAGSTQSYVPGDSTIQSLIDSVDVEHGKGPGVVAGMRVNVTFRGKLNNKGDVQSVFFDLYAKTPFTFRVGEVDIIPGLSEGVTGMRAGGKRVIMVPPSRGYTEEQRPANVPKHSALLIECILLSIGQETPL